MAAAEGSAGDPVAAGDPEAGGILWGCGDPGTGGTPWLRGTPGMRGIPWLGGDPAAEGGPGLSSRDTAHPGEPGSPQDPPAMAGAPTFEMQHVVGDGDVRVLREEKKRQAAARLTRRPRARPAHRARPRTPPGGGLPGPPPPAVRPRVVPPGTCTSLSSTRR